MSAPLLIDLSHTSHTRARTGIQRVTRSLRAALGDTAVGVTHDLYRHAWRTLEGWELDNLAAVDATPQRGAHWPLGATLRGQAQRLLGRRASPLPANSGVFVPEVFSPAVARALPVLFEAVRGPRIALFHDAIALRLPELTPTKTVARFPAYLIELLAFDGIAAVSEDSRAALVDYWRWLGARHAPPVRALPLGIDQPHVATEFVRDRQAQLPIVLSVGSIEGRKNHVALLEACEHCWSRGDQFSLHLVGLAQTQTGAEALNKIRALQAAGRPLRYDGPASEAELDAAYAACTFTVYPSLSEGFGLPVIESLVRAKPCICSARGALGESARGGGCIALDEVTPTTLADAMRRLFGSPRDLAALVAAAQARRSKTWTDYAGELTAWSRELAVTPRNER